MRIKEIGILEAQPYAPAGFICTVSFISPDKKAAIALALAHEYVIA